MTYRNIILIVCSGFLFFLTPLGAESQKLILMDKLHDNRIVNDSTITLISSDPAIFDITAQFVIKNNTNVPLAVYLRKTVNQINDSTTDYFCYYIKCWPDTDTTDLADTIPAGAEDYTFATHVCHIRRFDYPTPYLQPGYTSITYTLYDNYTLPEPVEASVTINYHLSLQGDRKTEVNQLNVYPNPADEYVSIPCTGLKAGNAVVRIFNHAGIQQMQKEFCLTGQPVIIDTRNLAEGIYTGTITTASGHQSWFRFARLR